MKDNASARLSPAKEFVGYSEISTKMGGGGQGTKLDMEKITVPSRNMLHEETHLPFEETFFWFWRVPVVPLGKKEGEVE